jgi:hypothetical protein
MDEKNFKIAATVLRSNYGIVIFISSILMIISYFVDILINLNPGGDPEQVEIISWFILLPIYFWSLIPFIILIYVCVNYLNAVDSQDIHSVVSAADEFPWPFLNGGIGHHHHLQKHKQQKQENGRQNEVENQEIYSENKSEHLHALPQDLFSLENNIADVSLALVNYCWDFHE